MKQLSKLLSLCSTPILLLGLTSPVSLVRAVDADFYVIAKGLNYVQASAGQPIDSFMPATFSTFVSGTAPGRLLSGSLTLPNGGSKMLQLNEGQDLGFEQMFTSKSGLDSAFPGGNYTLSFVTANDGTKAFNMSVPADSYPPTPHISNFAALETTDPSKPFTVTWDAFTGGTEQDYVQVSVSDEDDMVYQTPDPGEPGSLNGTSTSVGIPGGLLPQGRPFYVTLMFAKVTTLDLTSYSGAMGVVGFMKATAAEIGGGSTTVGDVSLYRVVKGQAFVQTGTGPAVADANQPYWFMASVEAATPSNVNGALVTTPLGALKVLASDPNGGRRIQEGFASLSALNTAYPDGTYIMTMDTVHDGTQVVPMIMPAPAFPPTPHFSNFDETQEIDPAANFTFRWDAFSNPTDNDFVTFQVWDPATGTMYFNSYDPEGGPPLPATTTSIVVPGGTLPPDKSLAARVNFLRVTTRDEATYPNALGIVSFTTYTRLNVHTGSGSVTPGQDVEFFVVGKMQRYVQADANAPVLDSDLPFRLFVTVKTPASDSVTSASFTPPIGGVVPLIHDGKSWEFELPFASQQVLDTAFPSGTYRLALTGVNDGARAPYLSLTGDTYPTAPRIANFTAAQSIDAASDFRLEWDAFTGGTSDDYVRVEIRDTQDRIAFETPDPGQTGALDGTATSVLIANGKLAAGTTYKAAVVFAKLVQKDTSTYPGVPGFATYVRETEFTVKTAGGAQPGAPVLSAPIRLSDGTFQFKLDGDAQKDYQIEVSTDLSSWQTLFKTNSPTMPVTLVDTGAKTLARRFYRAVGGGSTPPPGSISFSYYVSGGRFFNDVIGMPTFPVRFSCYRVIWEVQDSGTLPPPSEVKFTGPSGSGFNNVPGDFVSTDGQKKYIVSTCAGSATGPTLGTWTILYKGSPVNLTIADPLAMEHLAVPVPAAIVVAGVLKSFGWAYYDVTGVAMAAAPAYVATSQVQVNDKSGNRLYDSPELPGTSLMHILSKGVTWQSVGTVHMAYDDTAGNHYVISFQR